MIDVRRVKGDTQKVLASMEPGSFQMGVGSPPYFGLRQQGSHKQEVGANGQSLNDYIAQIVEHMDAVHGALDDQAVFFLNIGDTCNGSGGAGGDHNPGG